MAGRDPLRSRVWWWPLAVPATATAAAWLIQVLLSDALQAWQRTALLVAGTLSVLLAFLLPTRQLMQGRRDRADAEELASTALASYKVKIHDMLIPLSLAVTNVVAAPDVQARRDAQQALSQMVVDFAAENIGPERSRACFYMLENIDSRGRLLRLKNWHGRNIIPRQEFSEENVHSSLIMSLVDGLDAKLVDSRDSADLSRWVPGQSDCKTLICASVFASDRPLGVLMLDSLQPGDLKEEDRDLVRIFAQLLATGLAVR